MNIVDYLVNHTIAREPLAERLWREQRVLEGGTHPPMTRTVRGPVTLDGVILEESGGGPPAGEEDARKLLSSYANGFIKGPGAYVFEPWIIEGMRNLGRYGRAPTFVTFDAITLSEPWRTIGTREGEPIEQAMIETNGKARFYTLSEQGTFYLAREARADGGTWAVRKHNLFSLTPQFIEHITQKMHQ